jgi:RND superfamily putative drug exporter
MARRALSRPLTLRHPRAVLGVAALVLVVLGLVGSGVEGRLEPTTLNIPGTDSSQANQLLRRHFGASMPFAILLQGPPAAIDRQGPALIRALRAEPRVSTISPWDRGSVVNLRPSPRRALILADFHDEIKEAVNETVPELNRTIEAKIHAPVRATQTGFASISRALQEGSIDASERGELIALPFLLIVLLLVFRSPIAAAIPLGFGAVTVLASRGILYFAASWFDIDAFALLVCSMMGLALGVDYALLMVSRFREELAAGLEPIEAARVTRRTAGRTTAFAGATLLLSMLVSIFILPGSLLASLAGTLAMVVALTVMISTVLAPAVLALLGHNINRWRIGGAPGEGRSRLMILVGAALKRPAPVAAAIGAVVLLLAAPAIALNTGPPSPEQLPHDDPARQDAERIARVTAPGYEAPFVIVAASRDGAITDAKTLATLNRFQHRIAALPGVQAVVGPAQVSRRVAPLRNAGNAIFASNGNIAPVKRLARLGRSLGVAAAGVGRVRSGLTEASAGAGLLSQGSDRIGEGAKLLVGGLGKAAEGSASAIPALDRYAKGAGRLAEFQHRAALGALQLKFGIQGVGGANLRSTGLNRSRKLQRSLTAEANSTLPRLIAPAKAAEEKLAATYAALVRMGVGRTDPEYAAALAGAAEAEAALAGTDPRNGAPYATGYAGMAAELAALQARLGEDAEESKKVSSALQSTLINLKKLSSAAAKLTEVLEKIAGGGDQIAAGADRIDGQSKQLSAGLVKLSDGSDTLVGAIAKLGGGAEFLEESLATGAARSAPLQSGLRRGSVQVLDGRAELHRRVAGAKRRVPGIFDSGYFVLSALDGTPPRTREAVGTTIDLRHGGQAASMLVISHYSFNTPGSIALNHKLGEEAAALSKRTGLLTGVAGGAAQLNDYSRITRATIPIVVIAITLATFLVLVFVLRAVLLAALAVGLNLVTVGVAFGVLTALNHVPAGVPLGGHEYIDAVGATMIFGIVFGLSIDYAVFLLLRMREHYDREGDSAAAIEFGLEKTARVITGAAAIMMAVFIAFAGSSLATVSQLGVGLTVAVILDATVVRIVLLPALMLLIGDRVWWLPAPLKRIMPELDMHGEVGPGKAG